MGFNLIYWTYICGKYFLNGSFLEKYGKTAVFPGGYGLIGEIPHGRIRPDWGLKGTKKISPSPENNTARHFRRHICY